MKISTPAMLLCAFFASGAGMAEMSSDHYRISSSVISGGGSSATSSNYQMESTLGQPTPLMDPLNPPESFDYALFPGFWYTVASIEYCAGDFDRDGDVDGSDLAVFSAEFGRIDCDADPQCEGDFDRDGDVDGSDLAVFSNNFGRIDCPALP